MNGWNWSLVDQSPEQSEIEWLCIDVKGYKIINIYKPPSLRFTPTAIPTFANTSLYVGDFNYQHVNWGYNKTSDSESLDSWATSNNFGLLYNLKQACTTQKAPRAKLININSPRAAKVYFVIVWKKF